jgi:hypothetical protein
MGKSSPKIETLEQIQRTCRKRRILARNQFLTSIQRVECDYAKPLSTGSEESKIQKNIEKSRKANLKRMVFFILLGHTSRYSCFKYADDFPEK